MSAYLLLVFEDERAHGAQAPRAIAELIVRRARFADELRRSGALRDAGRFRPSREGKRVRRRGEAIAIEAGPFIGEHVLAAYYWLEAPSDGEAAALGQQIPLIASDRVEVRTLMKGIAVPDKDGRPGKVFGFAVLGAGGTEEAWTAVMDRIDAETQSAFPAAAFAGGNRLRALHDGPFLESKEVIGGVFFLRMRTIDDAVRWAADSRFVVHGALEIRELWRS